MRNNKEYIGRRGFLQLGLIACATLAAAACGVKPENFSVSTQSFAVEGLGEFSVTGNVPDGTYNFFTTSSLIAGGLNNTQLLGLEGIGSSAIDLYALSEGQMLFQGVLLPVSIAMFQISGGLQDMIEGPRTIYTGDRLITFDRSLPGQPVVNVEYFTQIKADSNNLQQATEGKDHIYYSDPPSDWRPPEQDHCGHDMKRYYAELLLNELIAILATQAVGSGSLSMTDIGTKPLIQNSEPYLQEQNLTQKSLKSEDCFFDDNGGSVFTSYKIMRDKHNRLLGEQAGKIGGEAVEEGFRIFRSQFSLDMPTDEVFLKLLEMVGKWWP